MVLDATLLNTQHYKVRIKGKVGQSWEWSSAFPNTSAWKLLKREPSGHPQQRSPTLLDIYINVQNKTILAYELVFAGHFAGGAKNMLTVSGLHVNAQKTGL